MIARFTCNSHWNFLNVDVLLLFEHRVLLTSLLAVENRALPDQLHFNLFCSLLALTIIQEDMDTDSFAWGVILLFKPDLCL